jgi:hypothetical protein
MMSVLASSIIDLHALWKIVAISVLAGVGIVGAFGYVLLGVSRYQSSRGMRQRAGYLLLAALAGGFCVASVVLGLIATAHK